MSQNLEKTPSPSQIFLTWHAHACSCIYRVVELVLTANSELLQVNKIMG